MGSQAVGSGSEVLRVDQGSRDIRNDLITSNRSDRYHHTRLINNELS